MLIMNEPEQMLTAYLYYEDTSASPPRQPITDSVLIIELSNSSYRAIYKTYTNTTGTAQFNFSKWAANGCINMRVLYCPFCRPDASECAFAECLNYAKISANKSDYDEPYLSPGSAKITNVSDIYDASDAHPPASINTQLYFPDISTVSYCKPPEPMSATPAMCLPLLIIFSLLGGALYMTGRNPFTGFNIAAPHVGRHIRYQARGRGVSMSFAGVVSAVGAIKNAAAAKKQEKAMMGDMMKKGMTPAQAKAALTAAGKTLASQERQGAMARSPLASLRRGLAGISAMRQAAQLSKTAPKGEKAQVFGRQMTARIAGGGALSTAQVAKGGERIETGGSGVRAADITGHIKTDKGVVPYYMGVAGAFAKIGMAMFVTSYGGQILGMTLTMFKGSAEGKRIIDKMSRSFTNNEARMKEDAATLKDITRPDGTIRTFVGGGMGGKGAEATMIVSNTNEKGNRIVTITATGEGKMPGEANFGKIDGKLAVTEVIMTLDKDGKVLSATAYAVAAKDFGEYKSQVPETKGETRFMFSQGEMVPASITMGADKKPQFEFGGGAVGASELRAVDLKDFSNVLATVQTSYVNTNKIMTDTCNSIQRSAEAEIQKKREELNKEIIMSPELQAELKVERNKLCIEALAKAGLDTPGQVTALPGFMAPGITEGEAAKPGQAEPVAPGVNETAVVRLGKALAGSDCANPEKADKFAERLTKELVGTASISDKQREAITNDIKAMLHTTTMYNLSDPADAQKLLNTVLSKDFTPSAGALNQAAASITNDVNDTLDQLRKGGFTETYIQREVAKTGLDNLSGIIAVGNEIRDSIKINGLDVKKDIPESLIANNTSADILAMNPDNLKLGEKVGDLLRDREHLQNEIYHASRFEATVKNGATADIAAGADALANGFSNYKSMSLMQGLRQEDIWKKEAGGDIDKETFGVVVKAAQYSRAESEYLKADLQYMNTKSEYADIRSKYDKVNAEYVNASPKQQTELEKERTELEKHLGELGTTLPLLQQHATELQKPLGGLENETAKAYDRIGRLAAEAYNSKLTRTSFKYSELKETGESWGKPGG